MGGCGACTGLGHEKTGSIDEVAVVLGLVLRPDRLQRLDLLPELSKPGTEVGTVVGHLLAVPAAPDSELEAPPRDQIERRDLLCGGTD